MARHLPDSGFPCGGEIPALSLVDRTEGAHPPLDWLAQSKSRIDREDRLRVSTLSWKCSQYPCRKANACKGLRLKPSTARKTGTTTFRGCCDCCAFSVHGLPLQKLSVHWEGCADNSGSIGVVRGCLWRIECWRVLVCGGWFDMRRGAGDGKWRAEEFVGVASEC